MKKLMIISLALCMVSSFLCMTPVSVLAETSGVCGIVDESGNLGTNLTWIVTDSTLTISGEGAMADFTTSNIPWKSFYSSITAVVIENGVTAIGDNAFNYHTALKSVTLGKDIASIGSNAFDYCSGINAVYITDLAAFCNISLESEKSSPFGTATSSFLGDNTKNLYLNGTIVKDLVIPDGISAITKYKFARCSSLESVTISAGVKSIDAYAFRYCPNLKTVTMSDTLTTIGNSAFSNCTALTGISLGAGVTTLGSNVFENTTALAAIGVSDQNPNYYALDGHLFDKDHTLLQYAPGNPATTYTLPVTTKKINAYAFKGTVNLSHLIIPNGITTISDSAFKSCTSLTQVTLPDTLTKIENHAFYSCSKLTEIVIPDSVTSIGTSTFYGCSNLQKAILSKNLTTLPYGLFSYCKNLTTAEIPENVTAIDSYAFNYCEKLTSLVIPEKVTYIGLYAFYNCKTLSSITMYEFIEKIDFRAFEGMTNLTDIYYRGCEEEWGLIAIDANNASLTAATTTMHYNYNAEPLRQRIPKQVFDADAKTLTITILVRNNAAPAKESTSLLGLYGADGNLKSVFQKSWGVLGENFTGMVPFTIENYTPAEGDYLKLFLWENPNVPTPWLPSAEAAIHTQ